MHGTKPDAGVLFLDFQTYGRHELEVADGKDGEPARAHTNTATATVTATATAAATATATDTATAPPPPLAVAVAVAVAGWGIWPPWD